MIRRISCLLLCLCWVPACTNSLPVDPGGHANTAMTAATGPDLRVEILDAHFVRHAQERMALEEFLYQMRRRGRAWAAAQQMPPAAGVWVSQQVGQDLPQSVMERIVDGLRLAGVSHISSNISTE